MRSAAALRNAASFADILRDWGLGRDDVAVSVSILANSPDFTDSDIGTL
jgi:hypothetical protein